MRAFSRLLCFILCFQLTPYQNIQAETKQTCNKGFTWDSSLNRCITSQTTANLMNSSAQCEQNDAECFRKNAQAEFNKSGAPGAGKNSNNFMLNVGTAGVGVVSALMLGGYKKLAVDGGLKPCPQASFWILAGTGATLLAGNLMADMQHKSRIKKIQAQWNEINNKEGSNDLDQQRKSSLDNQSESFELLAQSEESMARAAKMKSTIFALSTLAFASVGVIAAAEHFKLDGGLCSPTPPAPEAPSAAPAPAAPAPDLTPGKIDPVGSNLPLIFDHEKLFSELFIPTAHAKGDLGGAVIGSAAGVALSMYMGAQVSAAMISPVGRMGIGAVLGGYSLIMMNHASKQAEASEQRAKILRKMKEDFYQASIAINTCLPEDRTNTSKPECYCYTPEGQRNPARATSQICQNLFATKGFSTPKTLQADSFKGCVNNKNQFDEKCSCKQTKSCMKAIPVALTGLSTGTQAMITSAMAPIEQFANNALPANFSASAAANNAARILKSMKPEAQKQLAVGKTKIEKDIGLKIQNEQKKDPNFLSNLNNSMASSSPLPTSPKEAAQLLENEIKKSDNENRMSSTGNSSSSSSSIVDDFAAPLESTTTEADQVAEVMEKDMDYGTNDISTQPSTSLFDQLSSRYRSTGMRRLFEEPKVEKK